MTGKVSFKDINKLAIPAIMSGIIEPLISISDTAMAGHLPEFQQPDVALAAVGLAGAFISALVWILSQTKSAISAFISKGIGQNKIDRLRPLFSQVFWINLGLSLSLAMATFYFAESIFKWQNASNEVLEYATNYYKIRVWGFPFTLLTFTIFGLFRGLQNTYWAMVISIIGGLTNIGLDYYLAYELSLGVEGIAYASVIAQALMFILAVVVLLRKTKFNLKIGRKVHFHLKDFSIMCINLFLRTLFLNIAFWISNSFAASYGRLYLDSQSILVQIWLFSAFLLDGYSTAGNAISGKLLGEKSYAKLWAMSLDLAKVLVLISFGLMLIYSVSYSYIGILFTKDKEIINLFETYFWILIIMQPINSIAFLLDGIFKGLGQAGILRNVLGFATFIGFIPTVYLLDFYNFKLYAIWIAFVVWMLCRSLSLMLIFRKQFLEK